MEMIILGWATKLESNKAINSAYDYLSNFVKKRYNGVMNAHSFTDGAKALIDAKEGDTAFDMTKKGIGSAAVAYAGLNTVYRLGSGGGIYKDRNGNTDLIGIPFI